MFPENYLLSPNSLEGKKQILTNITPKIMESEKERKKEVENCEKFTSCKVNKGAKGTIEYFDLDIDSNIQHDEYEKR